MPKSTTDRLDFKALRQRLVQVEQDLDVERARFAHSKEIVKLALEWKRAVLWHQESGSHATDKAQFDAEQVLLASLPEVEPFPEAEQEPSR